MTDTGINTDTRDTAIPSRWGRELKKIRGNKMLLVGSIIVLIFIILIILGPGVTGHEYAKMSIRERFAKPSLSHLMGTDNYGRDTFARIIHGARVSSLVGVLSVGIGVIGGMLIGAIAGFVGGFIDNLLMRITDALLAFPPLLLAVGLAAAIGPSLVTVSVIIGIIYIPRFARVMRGAVLSEKSKEYVEAARAIGQDPWRILVMHIGPATLSPVIVMATIVFALAVIIEASLSFLGLGVPPPTPSWGGMLSESRAFMNKSVWMAIFPGLLISIAVLGLNLLGDGLRDYLDPKDY
jgi:ABC-type dipeptide/oligopeptide/nickel transport system permease subunit